jgi:ketosteroid isomerase-like protein
MSAEQNKALVRRFFEAQEDVSRGKADDLDALDKLLATDFVSHAKRLPGQ